MMAFQVSDVPDPRFDEMPVVVPWAAIALAIFLMFFGLSCFVLAWLHITQEILGKEQAVRQAGLHSQYHGAPRALLTLTLLFHSARSGGL